MLADAGATEQQIIKIGAFVRDEDQLPKCNELYLATFAHPRPARTTVAMGFGFLQFEIEATVYLG